MKGHKDMIRFDARLHSRQTVYVTLLYIFSSIVKIGRASCRERV